MTITRLEVWNFRPLMRDGPYAMSHVTQDSAYGRILKVHTADGLHDHRAPGLCLHRDRIHRPIDHAPVDELPPDPHLHPSLRLLPVHVGVIDPLVPGGGVAAPRQAKVGTNR